MGATMPGSESQPAGDEALTPTERFSSEKPLVNSDSMFDDRGYAASDKDVEKGNSDDKGKQTQGGKKGTDPFEVEWTDGDKDPLCPRSMGMARKWLLVIVTCGGALCVTAGSSIYTSGYQQLEDEFDKSRIVVTLGLSMFVLGLAAGPCWSPLSEFYGRRPIYLLSFLLYTIWIIPCAVAPNIQTLLIGRFFQGFSGSAFLSVSGGTVSDLFAPSEMGAPMAAFTAAPFIGPTIGPLIGGFICYNTTWKWTMYTLIIWSFCELVLLIFLVPETYHPILLRNKARKIRSETGDDRWQAPMEKQKRRSVLATIGESIKRPVKMLILEPILLLLCLYCALLLGILYLFFEAFPLVFGNVYHFNIWEIGLSFAGLGVGNLIGALTYKVWIKTRLRLITNNGGVNEPEFRLPPAMLGSLSCPIGMFMFAWTSYASVHWIVPIISGIFFGFGVLLVYNGCFTFLVEVYPTFAASALSANAMVRCVFAAAFPLFSVQMYDKLNYHWASSLLGFLLIAMMPLPYLFFVYGKSLRAKSKFSKR